MSETNNYPQHDNSFQSIKMLTSATCLNELITNSTLKNIKIHEGETIFIDEKPKTIEKNPNLRKKFHSKKEDEIVREFMFQKMRKKNSETCEVLLQRRNKNFGISRTSSNFYI